MISNARNTGKVPGPLQRKPILDIDLHWILDIWNELSKGRSKGSGWIGAINYKDILVYYQYKKLNYLSEDEIDRLTELIYELDAEYMDWLLLQESRQPKVRTPGNSSKATKR